MSSPSKRRELDLTKLMMSDWKVQLVQDNMSEFDVMFKGPKDTPYEGGVWKVHDLINVFEIFLPQLLAYPNPSHPLNREAAALMLRDPEKYAARLREYVEKYAQEIDMECTKDEEESEEKDDDDDDVDDDEGDDAANDDDEAAGKMDMDGA